MDRPRIRVLVVDDSAISRTLVARAVDTDPEMVVVARVGAARATERATDRRPDLVVLDLMTQIRGDRDTLGELRESCPSLPVVLFGAPTEGTRAVELEGAVRQARAHLAPPAGAPEEGAESLWGELRATIKALCLATSAPSPGPALPARPAAPTPTGAVDVLVIGSSTGGPRALMETLPKLPADFPVPIVIVQHMPAMFTNLLAERLDSRSRLAVREALHGQELAPGTAWIAPGNHHMRVERTGGYVRLALSKDPPVNSCRPAVDVLLESTTSVYRGRQLAVILTGMGRDGLRSCQLVREAGGQIIAQDEETSVVWGMPGEVVRAGLADEVLPVGAIAANIERRVTRQVGRRSGAR